MNRRRFLFAAPSSLVLLNQACRPSWAREINPVPSLSFEIHADEPLGVIPENMMGLSYESTQLGEPDFFAPANKNLVRLFQTLSPYGSLRLGGNTSEFTYFKANDSVVAPAWSPAPTQPKDLTPITPHALKNLRAFLDVSGWNCIYGLNLGTATPERVAQEAAAVTEILGPKLEYLQIGNEANNYIRYRLRPSTWDEKAFLVEWLRFARAIVKQVPAAKFGGPDMGADAAWMKLFASETVTEMKGHVVAITDHFYAEGPPSSPQSTMETLLFGTKHIDKEIQVTAAAGHEAKLPYRMTEVNSCYSGGKPGVSNTLGSALWAGDLTLKLLAAGFCGINFHGGSARQIRASLGGTLPGDSLAKKEAEDSYYTPIAGDASAGYTARPIFYGMILAARLAGSTLVGGAFKEPQTAVTAYAALGAEGESLQVALFNKGAMAVEVSLRSGNNAYRKASAVRLEGPAAEATTGVRLGGVSVGSDGSMAVGRVERLRRVAAGVFNIALPPASAALVEMSR
jgi:hypothetical protein